MRHTYLDRYREGSSLIHRLDPRIKLLGTLAFILVVTNIPAPGWPAFLLMAGLALLLVHLAEIPFLEALKRSSIALPFAGVVALSIPFTQAGTVLWQTRWGNWTLSVTDAGLHLFLSVVIKAWLAVLVSGLLVATTPFPKLLRAMRTLHIPPALVSTISFMYRYLFVLVDEAMRMQTARDARSVGSGRTIWWRAKVLGGMIGSLFIRSYERSERIYSAMLSRGFAGEIRSMDHMTWQKRDWVAGLSWMGLMLAALVLSRLIFGGR